MQDDRNLVFIWKCMEVVFSSGIACEKGNNYKPDFCLNLCNENLWQGIAINPL